MTERSFNRSKVLVELMGVMAGLDFSYSISNEQIILLTGFFAGCIFTLFLLGAIYKKELSSALRVIGLILSVIGILIYILGFENPQDGPSPLIAENNPEKPPIPDNKKDEAN